jgi:hypothetical protein
VENFPCVNIMHKQLRGVLLSGVYSGSQPNILDLGAS